jgi:hypothetical protein
MKIPDSSAAVIAGRRNSRRQDGHKTTLQGTSKSSKKLENAQVEVKVGVAEPEFSSAVHQLNCSDSANWVVCRACGTWRIHPSSVAIDAGMLRS